MKVGIGNDHAAVNFKNQLKSYMESKGIEVVDYGSQDPSAKDDYPDFALAVAEALVKGELDRGVLICGTGVGISIAANKVPGIRAGVCSDTATARLIVQHNNANIIALGERIVGIELAKDILDAFFAASFEGGRHAERIKKVTAIEEKYSGRA